MLLNKSSKYSTYFLLFVNTLGISGCAFNGITTGTSGVVPNDPRPTGNPISQGKLNGLNGQLSVTGSVYIFYSGGSYTLRLEGISVPSEASMTVVLIYSPQSSPATFNLTASSGNQNYSFSTGASAVTFNTVYIHSTQKNLDYASATLSSTSSNSTGTLGQ